MKIVFKFSILAAVFALTFSVHAQSPEELMAKANSLYQEERFNEAAEIFEQIIFNGYESEDLYYNLGNAYYRMGMLGK